MAKKVIDAKAGTVSATLAVRKEKGGAKTDCAWTLDFKGVSQDDLLELASRSVIISKQAEARNLSNVAEAKDWKIDVQEFLSRERGTFIPTPDSVAKKAANMSVDERRELIKKLQAMK